MNTIQHSLITLLELRDLEQFQEVIPYVLLPDAIRCYTKERKWSHFEMEPTTGEANIFQYPENLKDYDNINMKEHVLNDVQFRPAVIGENSSMEAFQDNNQHLPDLMYIGIKEHLRQDISFDKWVREEYDCSRKYEDKFIVNGKEVDGKDFRKVIADMEMDAVACLAYITKQELGITITNDWLRENVFEALEHVYPETMKENTCKYMIIPEDIEKQIVADEWDKLLNDNKYLTVENYQHYHDSVIKPIQGLEKEFEIHLEKDDTELIR
jgi:hypothetical protein